MSTVSALHAESGSTFADAVASNVRAEAARQGMRSSDLARALGVSPSTVSRKWRGVMPWSLEDVERVASVLGLPPAQLCANRDSNPEPADYEPGAVIVGPWPGAA